MIPLTGAKAVMKPEGVDRLKSFRLDFVQKFIKVDESSHTIVVRSLRDKCNLLHGYLRR